MIGEPGIIQNETARRIINARRQHISRCHHVLNQCAEGKLELTDAAYDGIVERIDALELEIERLEELEVDTDPMNEDYQEEDN